MAQLTWFFYQEDVPTVYPKKYAHGCCFAVLCCGYTLTDFPISIRLTSLALWQSNDCPSASKATLMNMDKYFMWIHYERLHNHNKAKHNKTVCIFLGIYCRFIVFWIAGTFSGETIQFTFWGKCMKHGMYYTFHTSYDEQECKALLSNIVVLQSEETHLQKLSTSRNTSVIGVSSPSPLSCRGTIGLGLHGLYYLIIIIHKFNKKMSL